MEWSGGQEHESAAHVLVETWTQQLGPDAHARRRAREQRTDGHSLAYNWWRRKDDLVAHVARFAATPLVEMLAMPQEAFRRLIGAALWREEFNRRLMACTTHARVAVLAEDLSSMAQEDQLFNAGRGSFSGAPNLRYIDSKHHARLLAMARLGLLPLEKETGQRGAAARATVSARV